MVLGAILLFTTLILVTAANSSRSKKVGVGVSTARDAWNISANFTSGDEIRVEIRPAASWATGIFDLEYGFGNLFVRMSISNPKGGATQFTIQFRTTEMIQILAIWQISVPQQDEGLDTTIFSVEGENQVNRIGGITRYNGTYTASVDIIFPERPDPPSYLGLFKKYEVTEYPYTSFLPVSAVTAGAGVILLLFGLKKQPSRASRRKKRAHLPSSQKHR